MPLPPPILSAEEIERCEASIIAALTPLGFRSFIIETNDVDAGATNYFPTTDAAPSVAALVSSLAMRRRAEGPVFIKRWPDHERVFVWSDSVGALNRSHADLDALLTSAGVSNWQINDNRNNYGQLVGIWLEDGTKHYDALRDGLKAFGFADVVELTGKASNEPDDDCEESEVL